MVIRDTDYKPRQDTPLRSPVAIGGFFIHFLRQRFAEGYDDSYEWAASFLDTDIIIETGQTIENEVRNQKPAIFVNLGSFGIGQTVIGDLAEYDLNLAKERNFTFANLNINMNVESTHKAECEAIAWRVSSSLAAAKDVVRKKYRILGMGPFSQQAAMASKTDNTMYVVSINFPIIYELSWKAEPVQTLIHNIEATIELDNLSSFYTNIYVRRRDQ